MNWGFESSTAEGWKNDPTDPTGGITHRIVSSRHARTTTPSLAVTMAIAAWSTNDARGISLVVPLCASNGTANLSGYTFTGWAYFTVNQGSIPMNAANLIYVGLAGAYTPVSQSTLNQWLQIQGTIDGSYSQVTLSLGFAIANASSEGFSGTMYLDDVQISPP